MIYLVLGMHKSGTTLLSKTLSASGIEMGCITNCDYDNKGGLVECPETQSLNMELLQMQSKHFQSECSINLVCTPM